MKLVNITKKYGENTALDGISLEFEAGKITAVLGESGAGKSTLLSVIAGATCYEGEVDGARGDTPKRRARCAYLFQEATILPNLTVEDNLKFVLPKDKRGGITSALERVGLEEKKRSYPFELSGGEKQRVAIARALACPHDLLLMDEPFSALDLPLKKSLIELVVSLWQESGETVVLVTHDVHEAAILASRALVLREGKIAADVAIDREYPRDFLAHCPEEEALTRVLLKQADFAS